MTKFRKLFKSDVDLAIDRRDKYKVKFVRSVSGVPSVVSTRKIKKRQEFVSEHDKTFTIDYNQPLYREKNTYWYVCDLEHGQMFADVPDNNIDPTLNHMILGRSAIRQLVMGMEKRKMVDILIYVALAIGVGILAGYLLGLVFPVAIG